MIRPPSRLKDHAPEATLGQDHFAFGAAEVRFLQLKVQRDIRAFRAGPRRFLQERGVGIEDSEPINLQALCKCPDGTGEVNLLVVRKQCGLPGKPRVAVVLEL